MLGILRFLSTSAALSTSEVWPEREMSTGTQEPPEKTNSGYSIISEAGIARADRPESDFIVAAAARATYNWNRNRRTATPHLVESRHHFFYRLTFA